MKRKRPRLYYINQLPKYQKDVICDTLDEAIEGYRIFKKSIANYFKTDMRLKEEYPDLYNVFTEEILDEEEIEMIKQTFYEELGLAFNDKLSSDEYELD
jgi:ribosome-interacting GTPase 1